MPIHCPLSIRSLSAGEFEQRDFRIMGHCYACQNELGRLCDEGVYEADLNHTEIQFVTLTRDVKGMGARE